jgi:hypothetical protein
MAFCTTLLELVPPPSPLGVLWCSGRGRSPWGSHPLSGAGTRSSRGYACIPPTYYSHRHRRRRWRHTLNSWAPPILLSTTLQHARGPYRGGPQSDCLITTPLVHASQPHPSGLGHFHDHYNLPGHYRNGCPHFLSPPSFLNHCLPHPFIFACPTQLHLPPSLTPFYSLLLLIKGKQPCWNRHVTGTHPQGLTSPIPCPKSKSS